ncbi:MAG: hypothetical protein ACPGWS_10105, partial [Solirubrobacterales bacterium]
MPSPARKELLTRRCSSRIGPKRSRKQCTNTFQTWRKDGTRMCRECARRSQTRERARGNLTELDIEAIINAGDAKTWGIDPEDYVAPEVQTPTINRGVERRVREDTRE